MQSFSQKHKGFTLIELLVVISILGLLSTIVLNAVNDAGKQSRDAVRLSDMRNIRIGLESFYSDHGRFPGLEEGIPATGQMLGVGNSIDVALSPYIAVPKDPQHDAGSGNNPASGSLYFYSYDPVHSIDDCTGTFQKTGAVIGFNYAESATAMNKDTCMGASMQLDDAMYNQVMFPPADYTTY